MEAESPFFSESHLIRFCHHQNINRDDLINNLRSSSCENKNCGCPRYKEKYICHDLYIQKLTPPQQKGLIAIMLE